MGIEKKKKEKKRPARASFALRGLLSPSALFGKGRGEGKRGNISPTGAL